MYQNLCSLYAQFAVVAGLLATGTSYLFLKAVRGSEGALLNTKNCATAAGSFLDFKQSVGMGS